VALRETLSRLGASSLVVARQRLELASLDVEEELLRLGALLAGALAAALLLTLALAGITTALVVYFWDSARLGVLLGVSAAFALAGSGVAWRLSHALRDKPRFMASTLAELEKDGVQMDQSS
jgi:uncharacterized membrane protein YqjE